jgi:hypothetical protein
MATQVQKAQAAARKARTAEQAAWKVWFASQADADQQAWFAAADAAKSAEDAVDTAEVWQDRAADEQADWWDAAISNARWAA